MGVALPSFVALELDGHVLDEVFHVHTDSHIKCCFKCGHYNHSGLSCRAPAQPISAQGAVWARSHVAAADLQYPLPLPPSQLAGREGAELAAVTSSPSSSTDRSRSPVGRRKKRRSPLPITPSPPALPAAPDHPSPSLQVVPLLGLADQPLRMRRGSSAPSPLRGRKHRRRRKPPFVP